MARWRRPGAGEILVAYVLFGVLGFIVGQLSHSASLRDMLWPFPVTAFLAWRVSRGGRVSRVILLLTGEASYAAAVLAVARLWDPAIAAMVVICAAPGSAAAHPAGLRAHPAAGTRPGPGAGLGAAGAPGRRPGWFCAGCLPECS